MLTFSSPAGFPGGNLWANQASFSPFSVNIGNIDAVLCEEGLHDGGE